MKNYFCLELVFLWSLALALALASKTNGLGLGLVHAVLEPIPGSRLFKSCVAYLTKNFGWLGWFVSVG